MTKSIECKIEAIATAELERAVAKDFRIKDQRIEDTINANKTGCCGGGCSNREEQAETTGDESDQIEDEIQRHCDS